MVGRPQAALAAALLITLSVSAQAYASPASLDHGFAAGGVLTFHTDSHAELLTDLSVLPNGKTLVLIDTLDHPAFEVWRLRKDGSPDPSYGGGDGVATFASAGSYEESHLAVDPKSGKTYVTAVIDNGTSPTSVWRLKANGRLDKAYGGGDGLVVYKHRRIYGLLATSGGKLLLAGNDFKAHTAAVWRLNDQGKPDHQFGSGGKVTLSTDVNDRSDSLARQPDGKIVVADDHYSPLASTLPVYRLKSNGARDHTFGQHGKVAIDPSTATVTTSTVWSPQVLLRPDGRMVLVAGLNQSAGGFRTSLLTAGLTSKGKPDHVFGKHVFTSITETNSTAALERDGKLVVSGYLPLAADQNDAVARFTTRGAYDDTWSGDGILPLPDAQFTPILDIAPQGRVLVGRSIDTPSLDARITALRGTRTPSCHGQLATQFGSNKADKLVGTSGQDVLVGLGGKDTLKGLGGDDVLCGNGGNDRLYGAQGDDTLIGGPGKDTLNGGSGHNILRP